MLDVEALRLTEEDLSEYNGIGGTEFDYPWMAVRLRELADAQLAKALWGVQEWLSRFEQGPACCQPHSLEDMLLVAGIPRVAETEGCEFCHKKGSAHCDLCDGRFCLDHFDQHNRKCREHAYRN